MAHIYHFWTYLDSFASRTEVLSFYTPEKLLIHNHSPGHLSVTGTRHAKADDMSSCGDVEVDHYKIVNFYKSPPTRLQFPDLSVFPRFCLYAGDFNCRHVVGVTMIM